MIGRRDRRGRRAFGKQLAQEPAAAISPRRGRTRPVAEAMVHDVLVVRGARDCWLGATGLVAYRRLATPHDAALALVALGGRGASLLDFDKLFRDRADSLAAVRRLEDASDGSRVSNKGNVGRKILLGPALEVALGGLRLVQLGVGEAEVVAEGLCFSDVGAACPKIFIIFCPLEFSDGTLCC